MKYRKKPVEVEAMQFPDDGPGQHKVAEWIRSNDGEMELFDAHVLREVETSTNAKWRWSEGYINTLEGTMTCSVGDFVIKGIKGEFYPCKPDIFEATYQKVEE